MNRLRPLDDASWPDAIADLRDGFAGALNVYRVMAHHPALLRAWSDLREHVVRRRALTAMQSEVVILRCGFRRGSSYEWVHHVVRGFDCGLSLARIRSLRGAPQDMDPDDRLLAGAVDALIDTNALTPGQQERLIATLGVAGMMDIIATVGFYSTLSYILNSFDTPVDAAVNARYAALCVTMPGIALPVPEGDG